MIKKLSSLLFEVDDVEDEDGEEVQSTPVKKAEPVVQQPVKQPEPKAVVEEKKVTSLQPPVVNETPKVEQKVERKASIGSIQFEPEQPKQTVKPQQRTKQTHVAKPQQTMEQEPLNYVFKPVISPFFGANDKDLNAVKTTTSKLTEKERLKNEKNVTPIISPFYGRSLDASTSKVMNQVEQETLEEVEDQVDDFSLDEILDFPKEEFDEPKQEMDALSFMDEQEDEPLFPDFNFDDLEAEDAQDSTTVLDQATLDFDLDLDDKDRQ